MARLHAEAPREAVTASNLGPIVSILTWIIEASVIIAVGIKFTLSSVIPRKRNKEDVALFLATAFSIGFTVSISLAVPNGVGRHQETLSISQLESLQMAVYAADILFVLVSGSVQASVIIFLHEVTPSHAHQRVIKAMAGFIALFSVSTFVVAAFPCHLPQVWELLDLECIDQVAFWEVFAGVNIIIESALVLFPIFVIYPLRMNRKHKAILITCFAARLIVVGTFVVQLYQAQSLRMQLYDQTFHAWKYLLATVFVQGLSIITVCIPYIRSLLLGMESGMIQTGHFRLPSRPSGEAQFSLHSTPTRGTSSNTDTKPNEPSNRYLVQLLPYLMVLATKTDDVVGINYVGTKPATSISNCLQSKPAFVQFTLMPDPHQKPKRRRVTQACDFCHKRAIKCQKSPAEPSCENCKGFSQPCTFDRRPRKRGPLRNIARSDGDGRSRESGTSISGPEAQEPWKAPFIASQATIVDLVDLYFEIVYPIFPLFHRPSLVRRVSRGEYTLDKPLFISIMAICALVAGRVRDGAVTNPRWNLPSLQGLDADVFYTETQRQLSSAGDQMDLHIIRSHALLAIAAIQNSRIMDLHRHLGIYHMLTDMYGLHDESNWPVGISLIEQEERRRLFWSIYTLDVFQSVVWGGTIRSREQQANVSYPTEVEDECLSGVGIPRPAPGLTIVSPSINEAGPSFEDPSGSQSDCWLFGWNFITDLYRVLEHALTRFRGNQCRARRSGFLTDIFQDHNTVTATSMTYDSRKDLFGFQAANITASLQLLRIVLFTADGASIQDRCRIASEVISAFMSIPVEYLVAISTPLLHHLGGIGTILGAVLEEPLREDEYNQVRTVMLSMAQLLDNLESIHHGARVSEKLRTQVSRIDEYMNTQRQIASLQQDTIESNCTPMPNPNRHESVHNGHITHSINEDWSFTIPSDLLSDLNWNFDMGLES
ncbi:hypothetical protein O1611_g5308 [Lasiodiplodia mahajangana]|uniref:Uncharacterized protein n=1 Tax=Lasiodiplodia mahajangana TaxID=1108764 RepID=A0ACC2JLJ3_9PEZI|nr:hypothetical protein O1611_g5308 [Lasiodiplodia mahajangana]